MVICIKQGKENKDRLTLLSEKLLTYLHSYYCIYTPKTYLFKSPNGKKYGATSVDRLIKKATLKNRHSKKYYPTYVKT